MIKAIETSKTIDREYSLSFEGVGHKKESVRLENGPNFQCVSYSRPRGVKSREKAVELIPFVLM